MLTRFRNLYHGFKKRGQATTRVTSTRLELDNIYREAKGMLHMTLWNGSSYDFTHIWESTRSARNRYRVSNQMWSGSCPCICEPIGSRAVTPRVSTYSKPPDWDKSFWITDLDHIGSYLNSNSTRSKIPKPSGLFELGHTLSQF